MQRAASLLVALAVAACSEEPSPSASLAPSATVASVLEPGAFPPKVSTPPVAAPLPSGRPAVAEAPVRVSIVPLSAKAGEDGYGNVVAAVHPAAIDLVAAGGWHAGGLSTTLRVGELRFYDMGYPTITTMRFVVADEGALPRHAEVVLEVGGPSGRRRVIAPSLPVTR